MNLKKNSCELLVLANLIIPPPLTPVLLSPPSPLSPLILNLLEINNMASVVVVQSISVALPNSIQYHAASSNIMLCTAVL